MSIEELFPNLKATGYRPTSKKTPAYNCIAWAAGRDDRWWEPAVGYYWPIAGVQMGTVKAAVQMFEHFGFKICKKPDLEDGYEKVAIYGQDEEYTHAARQLPSGKWTSKLGFLEDIEHDILEGLVGVEYGLVAHVMKRAINHG